MKYIKIIGLFSIIAFIAIVVTISYNKNKQHIDENFDKKAIPQFLANEEAFEQVKKHLITLPGDIRIAYDDYNFIVKDANYNYVNIDESLNNSLSQLFKKVGSMHIYYNAEYKTVEFELVRMIAPKGIIYVVNGKEAYEILKVFSKHQYIKDNWYYFEEMAGV